MMPFAGVRIWTVGPALPGCVMVSVLPPMLSVPVRSEAVVFAATENLTVVAVVSVIVTHPTFDIALHVHVPGVAVTVTRPGPPASPKGAVSADNWMSQPT